MRSFHPLVDTIVEWLVLAKYVRIKRSDDIRRSFLAITKLFLPDQLSIQ
jgi:hypothetical protein